MERAIKESTFWKIFCAGLAGFAAAVLCLTCLMEPGREKTEYDIIQTIIEDIPAYRAEIEGWDYQVTILSRLKEEPLERGLKRYC